MNQTKRVFELLGSILAMILGVILLFGSIYLITQIAVGYYDVHILIEISILFVLLFSIVFIIFTAILLPSPVKNGVYRNRLGLKITFLIITGLISLLEFLGGSLVYGLLFLLPFVFVLLSICLPQDKIESQTIQNNVNNEPVNTNDDVQKIEQLRKLKENGAISEEQYQEAIKKIIDHM